MIIYRNTLQAFQNDCSTHQIVNAILNYCRLHRLPAGSISERNSWNKSLPILCKALTSTDIDRNIDVAIEYRLEPTNNRIDFLIFGNNEQNKETVVLIELKQWSEIWTSRMENCLYANLGGGHKDDHIHPSLQSYDYAEILRNFYEYVYKNNVEIKSCSYLHNLDDGYKSIVNDHKAFAFLNDSPIFLKDDYQNLAEFVKRNVKTRNKEILYKIENSRITPSAEFGNILKKALNGSPLSTYDLDQAYTFEKLSKEVIDAVEHNIRRTIIVEGGAGTGKSIICANLLGKLINRQAPKRSINAVYCSYTFTPRKTISDVLVGEKDSSVRAVKNLFKAAPTIVNARPLEYDCVIVDEAHRCFNSKYGQGVVSDINMIEKTIENSLVNIFFIDPLQQVSTYDELTIEMIKEYAKKYGSEFIHSDRLQLTSQFRCLGGSNYFEFIKNLLGIENTSIKKFYPSTNNETFVFKVYDNPKKMHEDIKKLNEKYPSRLVAGFTRDHEWESKMEEGFIEGIFDFNYPEFDFKIKRNKKTNKKAFINRPESIDEVGCTYTIQGTDLDYAGVIIGRDLIYRDGKIIIKPEEHAKTDSEWRQKNRFSKEGLITLTRNHYYVLLTRARKGTFVYCEDKELNEYLKTLIIN